VSRAGTYVDKWLVPWLADKSLARSKDGIGGACYADPAHPSDEALEAYWRPIVSTPRRKALMQSYAIALERNPLAGVQDSLKRSAIPVRIVWGTADAIFSKESPEYLHHSFGNSKGIRRLDGRKLFWPEELPDVIAEEAHSLWS